MSSLPCWQGQGFKVNDLRNYRHNGLEKRKSALTLESSSCLVKGSLARCRRLWKSPSLWAIRAFTSFLFSSHWLLWTVMSSSCWSRASMPFWVPSHWLRTFSTTVRQAKKVMLTNWSISLMCYMHFETTSWSTRTFFRNGGADINIRGFVFNVLCQGEDVFQLGVTLFQIIFCHLEEDKTDMRASTHSVKESDMNR